VANPRVRLLCFPHAGGSSLAFKDWPGGLPDDVELCAVELPGRGRRLLEPPLADMDQILEALTEAFYRHNGTPVALFGHSFGALMAFECARRLAAVNNHPVHLFVSGHFAPHLPNPEAPIRHLPDPEFIAEVRRRYEGLPEEILRDDEMIELLLPALRADFSMKETYRYIDGPLLECPISAFGGEQDGSVTTGELTAWSGQTSGAFKCTMFPGGHFFIDSARESFLREVVGDFERSLSEVFSLKRFA